MYMLHVPYQAYCFYSMVVSNTRMTWYPLG